MSEIVERLRDAARFLDELEDFPELQIRAADKITRLRDETDEWEKSHNTLVKEIERLREENARLLGLLREAHVKMDANNLWSNLRNRVAAAIREGGKDE